MNRKQRRARQRRQPRPGEGAASTSSVAEQFAAALGHCQAGRFAAAEALCRQIYADAPDHVGNLNLLGVVALQLGRHEAAAGFMKKAIALDPRNPVFHNNLGEALRTLGQADEAAEHYRQALALAPNYVEAHNNLGCVLRDQERLDEALASFERALAAKPDYLEAHYNLGSMLHRLNRLEEAIASYRKALALKPDYAQAHWNLALALLVCGDFANGWREYEWRWHTAWRPKKLEKPLWAGEALAGRTILLYSEQGFGDSIQFLRFAPLVAARGGRVILALERDLLRLAAGCAGAAEVVAADGALPAFDLCCPLLSLPHLLGTTLETIPGGRPYLAALPAEVSAWRQRLAALAGLRVGLVWAGKPRPFDHRRSITLGHFAQLGQVRGVNLVSLQRGAAALQTRAPPPGLVIHDWTGELKDFADNAALVEALDLVLSVDTSMVHLAGALGKPVWLINHFDPDWRWLLARDDSPWYPTLRQFRQPAPGDWDSVIADVGQALQHLASAPHAALSATAG